MTRDWLPVGAELGFVHVLTQTSLEVVFARQTPVGEYRATIRTGTILGADGKTTTRQSGFITAIDDHRSSRAIPVRGDDLHRGDLRVFARVIDRMAADRAKRIARKERMQRMAGG